MKSIFATSALLALAGSAAAAGAADNVKATFGGLKDHLKAFGPKARALGQAQVDSRNGRNLLATCAENEASFDSALATCDTLYGSSVEAIFDDTTDTVNDLGALETICVADCFNTMAVAVCDARANSCAANTGDVTSTEAVIVANVLCSNDGTTYCFAKVSEVIDDVNEEDEASVCAGIAAIGCCFRTVIDQALTASAITSFENEYQSVCGATLVAGCTSGVCNGAGYSQAGTNVSGAADIAPGALPIAAAALIAIGQYLL